MVAKKTKKRESLAEQIVTQAVDKMPQDLLVKIARTHILGQMTTYDLESVGRAVRHKFKKHMEALLEDRLNSGDFDHMLVRVADKLIKRNMQELLGED